MKTKFLLPLALTATLFACEKEEKKVEEPDHDHEEELITTVKLTFTPANVLLSEQTFMFQDIDGPGGNDPTALDTIMLDAGEVYVVSTEFWNESEAPAEDITPEVLEEADEHIVCFETEADQLTIQRTDTDGTYELGLESSWVAGTDTTGSVTVSLKHQDEGAKDGTCAPGETDVEVAFPFKIK